jgi:pimeloyl-ACP methyl ester carboxylesterase
MTFARPSLKLSRITAGLVVCFVAFVALGGAMTALAGQPKPRGQMIDIGGRRLRIVCQGPQTGRPVVILEAGAFGFAADFGVVQDALAVGGIRSCAYDRAGMGFSDPSPEPRDGVAIAGDLDKLLTAARIPGPYVLAGHSMAGLRLRQFAARRSHEVVGVVLIDAATPESITNPDLNRFVGQFAAASRWAAVGASLGLFHPIAGMDVGNKIGLTGDAEREKRWAFANGRHNRTAAAEVSLWPAAARQAAATPPFDPDWPVAVITAGGVSEGDSARKAMQAAPATASRHGYVDHVQGAGHNTLLGPQYADHIVKGVQYVLANGP